MDTDKHEVLPQQHQLMRKSNKWGDDKSARKVHADLQNTKMKQDYMGKMLPWELAKNCTDYFHMCRQQDMMMWAFSNYNTCNGHLFLFS